MPRLPTELRGLPFEPQYSRSFQRAFGGRRLRRHQERIVKVIRRICRDPFTGSHLLEHKHCLDLRGKRDRHVAGDLIIIYAVCAECRRRGFFDDGLNWCCDDPGEMPEFAVVFIDVGTHKDLFRRD